MGLWEFIFGDDEAERKRMIKDELAAIEAEKQGRPYFGYAYLYNEKLNKQKSEIRKQLREKYSNLKDINQFWNSKIIRAEDVKTLEMYLDPSDNKIYYINDENI